MWPFSSSSNETKPKETPMQSAVKPPVWYKDTGSKELSGARATYRNGSGDALDSQDQNNSTDSKASSTWLDPEDAAALPTSSSLRNRHKQQSVPERTYQFHDTDDQAPTTRLKQSQINTQTVTPRPDPNDRLFDESGRFNPINSNDNSNFTEYDQRNSKNASKISKFLHQDTRGEFIDQNQSGSVLTRGAVGFRRQGSVSVDNGFGADEAHQSNKINLKTHNPSLTNDLQRGGYRDSSSEFGNRGNHDQSSLPASPYLNRSLDNYGPVGSSLSSSNDNQNQFHIPNPRRKGAEGGTMQRGVFSGFSDTDRRDINSRILEVDEAQFQRDLAQDNALWDQKRRFRDKNAFSIDLPNNQNDTTTSERNENSPNQGQGLDHNGFPVSKTPSSITIYPDQDPTAPHDPSGKRLFRRFNTSAVTPDGLDKMYAVDADGLPTTSMSFGHWKGVPSPDLVQKAANMERAKEKENQTRGESVRAQEGETTWNSQSQNSTKNAKNAKNSKGLMPSNMVNAPGRRRSHFRDNIPPNVTQDGHVFTVNPPTPISQTDFTALPADKKQQYQDQLLDYQKFTFRGISSQQREQMLNAQWEKLSADQQEECKEFQYLHLNFNTRKKLKHMNADEKNDFLKMKHFDQQRIYLLQPLSFEIESPESEYDQFLADDLEADMYLEGKEGTELKAKNTFVQSVSRIREIKQARQQFENRHGSKLSSPKGRSGARNYDEYIVDPEASKRRRENRLKAMGIAQAEDDPDGLNSTVTDLRLKELEDQEVNPEATPRWREALKRYRENPDQDPLPLDVESMKEQLRNLTPQQQFNILFRQHEKQLKELERYHTAEVRKATDWKVGLIQKKHIEEGGEKPLTGQELVPLVTKDRDMESLRQRQAKQRRELTKRQENEHKQLSNVLLVQEKARKEAEQKEHQLAVARSKKRFNKDQNGQSSDRGNEGDQDEDEIELELRLLQQFTPTFKPTGRPLEDEIAQKRKELLWRKQEEELREQHRQEAARVAALNKEELEAEYRLEVIKKLEESRERRDIEYLTMKQRGKMIDLKMPVSHFKYKPQHPYLSSSVRSRDERAAYMYKTLGMLLFGVNVRWNGGIMNGLLSTMVPAGQVPEETPTTRGYYVDIEHRSLDFSNLYNYYGVAAALYSPGLIPSFSHSLYEDPDLDPMTNPNVIGFDEYSRQWQMAAKDGSVQGQKTQSKQSDPTSTRNFQVPAPATEFTTQGDDIVNNSISTDADQRLTGRKQLPEQYLNEDRQFNSLDQAQMQRLQDAKLREYQLEFRLQGMQVRGAGTGMDELEREYDQVQREIAQLTSERQQNLVIRKDQLAKRAQELKQSGISLVNIQIDETFDDVFATTQWGEKVKAGQNLPPFGEQNQTDYDDIDVPLTSLSPLPQKRIEDPFSSVSASQFGNSQTFPTFTIDPNVSYDDQTDSEVNKWVNSLVDYQRSHQKVKTDLLKQTPQERRKELDQLVQSRTTPKEQKTDLLSTIRSLVPGAQFADNNTTPLPQQQQQQSTNPVQHIYNQLVYNPNLTEQERDELLRSLEAHQLSINGHNISQQSGVNATHNSIVSQEELRSRKENLLGRKLESNQSSGFQKSPLTPRSDIAQWSQHDLDQPGLKNPVVNSMVGIQMAQKNLRDQRFGSGTSNQFNTTIDSNVEFFRQQAREWDSADLDVVDRIRRGDGRFGSENYLLEKDSVTGKGQWSKVSHNPSQPDTNNLTDQTDFDSESDWDSMGSGDVVNPKQMGGYWSRQASQTARNAQQQQSKQQGHGIAMLQSPSSVPGLTTSSLSSLPRPDMRAGLGFIAEPQPLPEDLSKNDLKAENLLKKHGITLQPPSASSEGTDAKSQAKGWFGGLFGS